MEADAIREDVSTEQETEERQEDETKETQTEERFDPRRSAIDSISGKIEEERLVEMGAADEGEHDPEDTDEDVELVVSGEKKTVPRSQVLEAGIRTLQKDAAADKKLEEASILLREVREEKERLSAARQTDTERPRIGDPDTTPPSDGDDIEAELEKMEQAIRYGSEEEAREALRPIVEFKKQLASARTVQTDPNAIYRAVDERLTQSEILRKFKELPEQGGFADIEQHPYLRKMAAEAVDELIKAEGKSGLDWSTYEEAGKRVRERVAGLAKAVSYSDGSSGVERSLNQKVERKRKIDNVFGVGIKDTGNRGDESSPRESSEEERRKTIEEMRRARGQPV